MLDIGWSELVVIAVVALVVIGPKELPTALRTVGGMLTKLRRMAGEFQGQFQQAMKEAELGDVQQQVNEIRQSVSSMKGGLGMTPTDLVRKEIGGAIAGAGITTGSTTSSTAAPTSPSSVSSASTAAKPVAEPEPAVSIPSAYAPSPMFKKR
ncbi:MAG: Sec-independent protein translocase protein TatB [Labrys sp. (in: a-proteobacteria)]|jgi:sec-independent protein translocase protein TatB